MNGPTSEQLQNDLLVLRCQQGDAAALELLIRDWQERLWLHARRLTGDEDVAYDILQESLVAIVRGLGKLRDPAAFAGWAYRIVGHKSHDWLRRECRKRKGMKLFTQEWANQPHDEPSESGEPDERIGNLQQAMEQLPGPDRALLALKYEEGFDSAQIAEVLKIAEATVRTRLFRLRQKLRTMMEESQP